MMLNKWQPQKGKDFTDDSANSSWRLLNCDLRVGAGYELVRIREGFMT